MNAHVVMSSLVLALLLAPTTGFEQFRSRLPNGSGVSNARALGHNHADGGGGENVFGADFARLGHDWTDALCRADSDGDGQKNGQELGDPCCVWKQADYPRPQRVVGISHPGDATQTADPALWTAINCSDYRLQVERVLAKSSPAASSRYAVRPVVVAVVSAIALQSLVLW